MPERALGEGRATAPSPSRAFLPDRPVRGRRNHGDKGLIRIRPPVLVRVKGSDTMNSRRSAESRISGRYGSGWTARLQPVPFQTSTRVSASRSSTRGLRRDSSQDADTTDASRPISASPNGALQPATRRVRPARSHLQLDSQVLELSEHVREGQHWHGPRSCDQAAGRRWDTCRSGRR